MTVKVRQLVQHVGPPTPPPPVPTMFFVQQPTDTIAGEEFSPPVSVQISDNGNDVLLITSDTCSSIGQQTVLAVNGFVQFTGLTAGIQEGTCTLRVHNIIRPEVADITSFPFEVLPEIPPPVVTMEFVQQPTDTETGELFDPPVSVSISDGGSDSLTIIAYFGTCSITPVTVSAVDGLAVFSGLRAGSVGEDCRLIVHNNTRPEIDSIVSDPFDVFEVPPPPVDIEIVNDGNAYALQQSQDAFIVDVIRQPNGDTIDSTGADFALFIGTDSNALPSLRFRAFAFLEYQDQFNYVPVFPDVFNGVQRVFSDYVLPDVTGPDSGVSFRLPNGDSPNIATSPAGACFYLRNVDTDSPIITYTTASAFDTANTPIVIDARAMAVSIIGYYTVLQAAPEGWNFIFLDTVSGIAFGLAVAWIIGDLTTQNPVWIVPGSEINMVTFAIRAAS